MPHRRLWIAFTAVILVSFAILGFYGRELYRKAPPIPSRVEAPGGRVLFTGEDIRDGQNVWQSLGGQVVGSIWGHGAYVAPDWSADFLHREAVFILDRWARREGAASYGEADPERQAALRARLQGELRKNAYDPATGAVTVSQLRAEAFAVLKSHYGGLFQDDPALEDLRNAYAIQAGAIKDPDRADKLAAFFF